MYTGGSFKTLDEIRERQNNVRMMQGDKKTTIINSSAGSGSGSGSGNTIVTKGMGAGYLNMVKKGGVNLFSDSYDSGSTITEGFDLADAIQGGDGGFNGSIYKLMIQLTGLIGLYFTFM